MNSEQIELRIARLEDIEQLCRTAADPDVRTNWPHWKKWAQYNLATGPAYSAFFQGKLVGAGGLHLVRKGIANAWAVIDRQFELLPKGCVPSSESLAYLERVLWCFKEMIRNLCEEFEIRRIRSFSRKGFSGSQRLLKHLGFVRMSREKEDRYYYVLKVNHG